MGIAIMGSDSAVNGLGTLSATRCMLCAVAAGLDLGLPLGLPVEAEQRLLTIARLASSAHPPPHVTVDFIAHSADFNFIFILRYFDFAQ